MEKKFDELLAEFLDNLAKIERLKALVNKQKYETPIQSDFKELLF